LVEAGAGVFCANAADAINNQKTQAATVTLRFMSYLLS
jgi:hypothetical protein